MANETGQSLIEIIVALTVGVLVITALTFAVIFSLRNANFAKTSSQVTKLAQEGIERVRTGRDRNALIGGLPMPASVVTSWNGSSSTPCSTDVTVNSDSIWCYQISIAGGCNNLSDGGQCYFNVAPTGVLTNIASDWIQPTLPSLSEEIPSANQSFQRVVLLSDEAVSFNIQKKVTVIVRWTDFAGPHESNLTTILRKL